MFVADRTAHQVYAFARDGALLRTFEHWREVGRLNNPADLAVDDAENLYIADAGNHRVLKLLSERGTAIVFDGSQPKPQGNQILFSGRFRSC